MIKLQPWHGGVAAASAAFRRRRDAAVLAGVAALSAAALTLALRNRGAERAAAPELILLAVVLLAMRWQVRGALVGTAAGLLPVAVWRLFEHSGRLVPGDAILQALLWLTPALVVGLLARGLSDSDGVNRQLATHEDLRHAARQTAQFSEERFRSLLQNASDLMALLDADGSLRYVSPSVARVLGYPADSLIGTRVFDLIHPEDRTRVLAFYADQLAAPPVSAPIEFRCRDRVGEWRHLEASFNNLLRDPSVGGVVVNARDVTERIRFQERLSFQAFHDSLTGLPNRSLFMDRLDHALSRASRLFRPIGVLFLDLDRFKVINDSLGHAAGDALLIEIGRRIGECLRAGDSVARLGGDEFAVLLEEVRGEDDATLVADRILASMRAPVMVDGTEIFAGISIGIALSTPDHARPADLLQEADIALYWAKGIGRGCYAVFDPAMNADLAERLDLETDLRRALERSELRLHYQPIVALSTQCLTEVEVLVRWEHPERGLIQPAQFLPLAEESGLIVPLGHWVLRRACWQAARWAELYPEARLIVSVNLSTRQFQHPKLVDDVATILAETALNPRLLKLELTESTVMADSDSAARTLDRLRQMGVQIAIDNFGTGYSSLSYLKRLPVTALKIDRSFVDGLTTEVNDTAIVESVVALARSLGLAVTAEGIETTQQLACLRSLGCDYGQGYLFARPLAADAIADFLSGGHVALGRTA